MKEKKIQILGLLLSIIVIIIDQASKWTIVSNISEYQRVNILPFFNLTLIYNKGISFGMINGGSIIELALISIITLSILFIVIRWLFRTSSLYVGLSIGLIVGGAIGNTIDRFFHQGVVDFLDFHIGMHHYPSFNVADSSIFIGVVLLLLENLFTKKKDK